MDTDKRINPEGDRWYIAIDLKSFYASVECVERGLDALNTNLVVADESRTDKTICLAVSPSLKARGVPGRPRLFEAKQVVRQVNEQRRYASPNGMHNGRSIFDDQLREHPTWEVDFIVAPPRMALYIEYSTRIFEIYLKYVAPEDIHVYSIDEAFIDVTSYLRVLRMTPHEMAMMMIRDVLRTTGITATAGIGTNMYLAKVAMDIVAKKMPPDADGVRIASLDIPTYREQLWDHQPLTDFWRVGRGIQNRLARYGINTMGDIARASLKNEDFLYSLFGVNAELLIDHAWGQEPVTIDLVKAYRPTTHSISSGQVLTAPYTAKQALVVLKEMAEGVALDLLDKGLVTDHIVVDVGYDVDNLRNPAIQSVYKGPVSLDHYGRVKPKSVHGSETLTRRTFASSTLQATAEAIFKKIVDRRLLIRRLNICAGRLIPEDKAQAMERKPRQLEFFTDYEALEREQQLRHAALEKERRLMSASLTLKKRFGKNALLRGLDYCDGATARDRNSQIGGHKA